MRMQDQQTSPFILKQANKYNHMQSRTTSSPTPFKWQTPSEFQQIVKKDNRTEKTRAYSFQEQSSEGKVLKYVMPLSELLLLNLMRLLKLKIVAVYQNCLSDGEKYYLEVLSSQEATTALEKLYHWDDFSKIERYCAPVNDHTLLPEFIWVKQIKDVSNLKKELDSYDINYSYLNENFLIQKGEGKNLECEVVIQALKRKKGTPQPEIGILSNCLLVELYENDKKLLQKYWFLETEINAKSIRRCQDVQSKICFAVELKDLLHLLQVRSMLFTKQIHAQLIPWGLSLKMQQRPKQQTFSLQAINSEVRKGDILDLQRHLNSPNSQLANHVEFTLKNWGTHQPFLEDEMEDLQNLLMSYQHDPQEVGLTRFTAIADFAKRVIPKCRVLNEYAGNAGQLTKELGLKQNNYIFQNFVKNAISTAKRKGEMVIQKQQNVKQPLHEHIAQYEEFQSKSRKAARWEHLFSLLGASHFLRERQFEEKDLACRDEYIGGIQGQMLLDLSCFGCCPFFYSEQNIRNSEVNTTPFRLIDSSENIQILNNDILDAMRELMEDKGGVILFDCLAKNREVRPKGTKLSLDRQNEVNNLLMGYFEDLVNNDTDVGILKQISISFVPVLKNPLKHRLKNGKRSLIDQTYVTRVKIDRIWNKKCLSEQEQREMIFFGPKISCFHSGPCSETYQQVKKEKSEKSSDRSKKTTKQAPPRRIYAHISLIIWDKKQHRDALNKQLKEMQKGEVDLLFEKYNLKCTSNTALVHHDISFNQLKDLCKKVEAKIQEDQPGIRFGRFKDKDRDREKQKEKMLIVAEIHEMITLPDRVGIRKKPLELGDFNDMTEPALLKEQFQDEEVILWKFVNKHKDTELYFQLKDQKKSALLYFILRSNSEKARFKLPPDSLEAKGTDYLERFTPAFVTGGKRKVEDMQELKADLFQLFRKKKEEKTNKNGSAEAGPK